MCYLSAAPFGLPGSRLHRTDDYALTYHRNAPAAVNKRPKCHSHRASKPREYTNKTEVPRVGLLGRVRYTTRAPYAYMHRTNEVNFLHAEPRMPNIVTHKSYIIVANKCFAKATTANLWLTLHDLDS